MRALVGVKRVIDYTVKIRIKPDGSGIEKNAVKHSINPFCEIAVEEAVRLKEKGVISHISAITIGDKSSTETLKHALALGADEGIHISTTNQIDTGVSSSTICKVLEHFIMKNKFDLVVLGKQSIDTDYNHTAQFLSGLINWPVVTFASEVKKDENDESFLITREIDTGLQKLRVKSPFIFSCDLRLNTPRYNSLKSITAVRNIKIYIYIYIIIIIINY